MVMRELGGAPLGVIYTQAVLNEPTTGAGIPVGALVRRGTSGFEFITNAISNPIPIGGIVAYAKPLGDGSYECEIMVCGYWAGEVYEWDADDGEWEPTTRYRAGVLQNPIYIK